MNIAFVINFMKNEGPCNVVKTILNHFDYENNNLYLITLFDENDAGIIKAIKEQTKVSVYELNYKNRIKCICHGKKEIEKIIFSNNIEIVHSHTLVSDYLLSRLKAKAIKVATIHNNISDQYKMSFGRTKGKLFAFIQRAIYKKLDYCVCCSESVFESEKQYNLPNCSFIENGVDVLVSHSVSRGDLNIPEDSYVFVYSGGLNYRKNVPHLIDLFNASCGEKEYLIILGNGQDFNSCKEKESERVKILGFKDNPHDYYRISDFYVSASRSEGLSMSQLESLSCGLIQLVSDIPSHREVVMKSTDYVIGYVFDDDSFANMHEMAILLLSSEKKAEIMHFYNEFFSGAKMTEQYYLFYKRIGTEKE